MERLLRAAVTLLLALLPTVTAWADEGIKDVMVIGGSEDEVNSLKASLTSQGWHVIDQDLNRGAGGDYIYLLYKSESSNGINNGYITDFYISNAEGTAPDSRSFNGRTYKLVTYQGGTNFVDSKGDLNRGAKGDYIHLYYTKESFTNNRFITGISFNSTQAGAVGVNGDTTTGYDLNKGCGAGSDYIYMHLSIFSGRGLPYSYDFEATTLEEEGWTTVNCYQYTNRVERTNRGYAFHFCNETDKPDAYQYLISPEFDGRMAMYVEFDYERGPIVQHDLSFQIGYSTQTNDISSFTWDSDVVAGWGHFGKTFPKGTKYVAARAWTTNSFMDIYLDNFNFTVTPVILTLSDCTEHAAKVSWDGPQAGETVTGYVYQFKTADASQWSTETSLSASARNVTISGLSAHTDYQFRLKAIYGSSESNYANLSFTTAVELPYSCGFENGMDGWSQVVHSWEFTGISDQTSYEGARCYRFYGDVATSPSQYLISPRLPGDCAVKMSFYYLNAVYPNTDRFRVGYSTTDSDVGSFTWSDEITAQGHDWELYEKGFPERTKYVAIQYPSGQSFFFVDDFSFEVYSALAGPADLSVNTLTDNGVSFSWSCSASGVTGFAYQYKKRNDNAWSSEKNLDGSTRSVALTGLEANTTYDFRIKACYDSNASNYVTARFTTEGSIEPLPHFQGFENGMGGWRIVNSNGNAGIKSWEPREGSYDFGFAFDQIESNPPQYLISPQLNASSESILSFYYQNNADATTAYRTLFSVGYSTTDKNPEDFSWSDEISVAVAAGTWPHFVQRLPQGTKYVAIRLRAGQPWLYLDDISITPVADPVLTAATVQGQNKYVATFFDGNTSWVLPEGATAYTAGLDGDEWVFYRIDDRDSRVIPAGTAVVILMDKTSQDTAPTKTLAMTPTTDSINIQHSNDLLGSDAPQAVTEGKIGERAVYVLGIQNGTLGFYPFSGTEIPAGKAYYLK
ncbi:MAG: choice-of-anchor J domain-containing protein [Bacteroidales bacterium]|nr:choice-of-anchor J domain-containing protein [Bacteroidales bacterium]